MCTGLNRSWLAFQNYVVCKAHFSLYVAVADEVIQLVVTLCVDHVLLKCIFGVSVNWSSCHIVFKIVI